MRGVSFLVDDAGSPTSVILDLRKHRRLWEDIHDRLLIESRRHEQRLSFDEVTLRLKRGRKQKSPKAHA
jgi:hypothetical protein